MFKTELIQSLANDFPFVSETLVADIFNSSLELIKQTLQRGDRVQINGFGTFKIAERAERNGHNPRTGEPLTIPAHKIVHFKPAPKLNAALNGGVNRVN